MAGFICQGGIPAFDLTGELPEGDQEFCFSASALMAVMIEAAMTAFGMVGDSVLRPDRSMIVTAFVSDPNPDPLLSRS